MSRTRAPRPRGARQQERVRLLLDAIQALSSARSLGDVTATVRTAARALGQADGATFILRDDDQCHYVDEDAIGPLWKGSRFPLHSCVSGWAMLNRASAAIPDILTDARVPQAAYRGTFVRSMAMVPVRADDPLGAIGIYWASHHEATQDEMQAFQDLANAAAVALENVRLLEELETRVQRRTSELLLANRELEAFTHTISHDLRAPLRHLVASTQLARRRHGDRLAPEAHEVLGHVEATALRMNDLLESLLGFAAVGRQPLARTVVPMRDVARGVADELEDPSAGAVEVHVADDLPLCEADATLMRQVLQNLLGNAMKFTRGRPGARIEVGGTRGARETVYFVRDNGAGFDMAFADRLFTPFQTLHSRTEFPGSGVGLSIVQRIVERHGGRVWAEGEPGRGATFYFSVPV